jgi:hypothetical protein
MTPFMSAVQDLLDGARPPRPHTEPSRVVSVAEAANTQVVIRSLAEQLVCEANAVLREHGEALTLVDDSGSGELAFSLRYADRSARLRTALAGRTAVARLLLPETPDTGPRQLSTEDELQALLLSLLAGSPI